MNERKQTAKAVTKLGVGSGHSSALEDAPVLTLQKSLFHCRIIIALCLYLSLTSLKKEIKHVKILGKEC